MSEIDTEFDIQCKLHSEALKDVHEATIMFFSNKFVECEQFLLSKMEKRPEVAHTHAHVLSMLKYVMAIFTNEKVSLTISLLGQSKRMLMILN